MKKIIVLLAVLIFVSCSNSSNKTVADIKVDFLDSLMVDGCSQTYTFDSVSVENKKYVFSSDLMENANIKINGTQILLKRDNANSKEETVIWKADKYIVEVRVHSLKQTCDECSYDKGTITIIYQDKKQVIKVHGESGC